MWAWLRRRFRRTPVTRDEAIAIATSLLKSRGMHFTSSPGVPEDAILSLYWCEQEEWFGDSVWWVGFTCPHWQGVLPDYVAVEVNVRNGRARVLRVM
jgi:hypothetical protein